VPKIVNHELRRNEISAVAAALIASGGMEMATIREIAAGSGYSKGVVEHYFENKDALISAALSWINQCYERRVEKATRGLLGMAALQQRVQATLPLNKAVRDEWKVRLVFWSVAAINEELRKQQEQRLRRAADYFEGDIRHAIENGEISPADEPIDLARRLVTMTTGISIAALHSRSLYTRQLQLGEVDCFLAQWVGRNTP